MPHHDIIVIGGSAGAMVPTRFLLGALPPDLAASIFIVLHMPVHSEHQAEVLAAASALPLEQASAGMAIRPGHVYVARPDQHLILTPQGLRLGRGPRENMSRPAIDPLFRSAAVNFSTRVIAVLLSGMLNDGVAGLDAVRRCGGVTVVQDPDDATLAEMPRTALEAGLADHCLPAVDMIHLLTRLVAEPALPPMIASDDIRVEVRIAEGRTPELPEVARIACPATLTCPHCAGVLSEIETGTALRYRCQAGHGFTAETLLNYQGGSVDEALSVALRIMQERADLVERMGKDARGTGRSAVAKLYERRAEEYRRYAATIRQAVVASLE